MGKLVCAGAMLKCSFGMAPATLNVLPLNRVLSGAPSANIMDNVPMLNILPFGMCQSPANPMVAAATAADCVRCMGSSFLRCAGERGCPGGRSTRLASAHAGGAYGDAFVADFDRIPPGALVPAHAAGARKIVRDRGRSRLGPHDLRPRSPTPRVTYHARPPEEPWQTRTRPKP